MGSSITLAIEHEHVCDGRPSTYDVIDHLISNTYIKIIATGGLRSIPLTVHTEDSIHYRMKILNMQHDSLLLERMHKHVCI